MVRRKLIMAVLGLLSVTALLAGCSADDADEAREDKSSSALSQCVPPDDSQPPSLAANTSDVHLEFDHSSAETGMNLPFKWDIPESEPSFSVGDEATVECWDGEEWVTAWFAVGLFNGDDARAIVDPTYALGFTDDGFRARRGNIAVPAEAGPGTYRIVQSIGMDRFGSAPRNEDREARFVIE